MVDASSYQNLAVLIGTIAAGVTAAGVGISKVARRISSDRKDMAADKAEQLTYDLLIKENARMSKALESLAVSVQQGVDERNELSKRLLKAEHSAVEILALERKLEELTQQHFSTKAQLLERTKQVTELLEQQANERSAMNRKLIDVQQENAVLKDKIAALERRRSSDTHTRTVHRRRETDVDR